MVDPLRLATFLVALARLIRRKGGRLLSKEKIEARLEICKPCNHFTGDGCVLCGCCVSGDKKYLNKIAFPTERCPDTPPRWIEDVK